MLFTRTGRDRKPRGPVPLDHLGRRRSPVTLPGHRRGQRPPNYGLKLPAEPLSPEEVLALMAACGRGDAGSRNRAMIVLLWRGGLRCAEALALELRDLDERNGTVTVRHGKGNRRRVVGLDPTAWAVLEQWLERRRRLAVPAGSRVICTITRGNLGRPLAAPYWRQTMKRLAAKAGIEKRVHSHGLRHTHAVELMREGASMAQISRQLGHSSIAITDRYVNHLDPHEVVELMRRRAWPAAAP